LKRSLATRAGRENEGRLAMRPHFFPRDERSTSCASRCVKPSVRSRTRRPIGAVVVHEGKVIGAGRNERELRRTRLRHAATIALREEEGEG